ncbi:MAG TPA: glycosyltransferase [Candidatus Acidoferrales bacterium]|nr:glycosyltransferase [Candidatus Acidoferrales bacterium]
MHIGHFSAWRLPVERYGGTQRVIYWLAKAQAEMGHRVTLISPPGSHCPGVEICEVPKGQHFESYVPKDLDIAHFSGGRWVDVDSPYIVTVHGNGNDLVPLPSHVFVSRDHARRAGARAFVHNGIDPDEFIYRENKDDYLIFLGKLSRPYKGIATSLRLARQMGFRLLVVGGTRFDLRKTGGLLDSLRGDVHFLGEVGGRRKAELLAGARALLSPISWPEPFGLVVAEALMSGTPVITTPYGAMPELITPEVGFLCKNDDDLIDAIKRCGTIDPAACRRHAMEHFSNHVAATRYLDYYRRRIAGLPIELGDEDQPTAGFALAGAKAPC